MTTPDDFAADLSRGRLSQSCPACGTTEAGGSYCTRCERRTGPPDWRKQARSEAQTRASRVNSHRRAETRSEARKSPSPAILDGLTA